MTISDTEPELTEPIWASIAKAQQGEKAKIEELTRRDSTDKTSNEDRTLWTTDKNGLFVEQFGGHNGG
ncbi:hypothetical protein E4U58_002039, partial [Claviceps cyperi]